MDDLPPGRSNQLQVLGIPERPEPVEVPEVAVKIARVKEQQALDPALAGSRICEWCCNFFDYAPRNQAQLERLHQALFISGPGVNAVHFICETCYEQVTGAALRNDVVEQGVGVSNSGHPNLLLRHGSKLR